MSEAFTPYLMSGLALVVVGLMARALGRIADHVAYGVLGLSQVVTGVGGFLSGNTVWASISTAAAACLLWYWWNGGGGDDTKRRLRKWGRRFRGARRTAPASS